MKRKLDSRWKVLLGLTAMVAVSLLPEPYVYAAGLFLAVALVAKGISVRELWRRLHLALPLLLTVVLCALFTFSEGEALAFTINAEGVSKAGLLTARVVACIMVATLLERSMGAREIFSALRKLKVPEPLVGTLEITGRYIHISLDEVSRLRLARLARGFEPGSYLWHLRTAKTLAGVLGVLLVRSIERGERTYRAMLARGYGGF